MLGAFFNGRTGVAVQQPEDGRRRVDAHVHRNLACLVDAGNRPIFYEPATRRLTPRSS